MDHAHPVAATQKPLVLLMCTLVILRRPEHDDWPVLIAANRDELRGRPSRPPARHWNDRPDVIAGLDVEAGGSWLGVNDQGVTAAILNRQGTLGRQIGKRSRGELVLDALDHADANSAAEALSDIDPEAYRHFNLIIADNQHAFWLRHAGGDKLDCMPLPEGLSMITAGELNDPASPRIRRYRPLFESANIPQPPFDWSDWQLLMMSKASETADPMDAMCIRTDKDYGTRSSSFLALPTQNIRDKPVWRFADGPPDNHSFEPVQI